MEDFQPQVFNNQETIKQAVRHGLGVTIISRYVVEDYQRFGFWPRAPCRIYSLTRYFYLVSHAKRIQTPAAKAFKDFVRSYFQGGQKDAGNIADHAATTYPRPPAVVEAMVSYLRDVGCNPGRGGYHRALNAARLVYDTRSLLADFFHVPRPEQVVFTPSVTYALNLVIKGLLTPGDHVIISSMEHNAVVRPLTRLAAEKVYVDASCQTDGTVEPNQIACFTEEYPAGNSNSCFNVTGTICPVYEVGRFWQGLIFYIVLMPPRPPAQKISISDLQ